VLAAAFIVKVTYYAFNAQYNISKSKIITLLMEAVSSSGKSLNFYKTTRHNIPEGSHFRTCHCENLKSHQILKCLLYFAELNCVNSYNRSVICFCDKSFSCSEAGSADGSPLISAFL
jgi:hypothetical protein